MLRSQIIHRQRMCSSAQPAGTTLFQPDVTAGYDTLPIVIQPSRENYAFPAHMSCIHLLSLRFQVDVIRLEPDAFIAQHLIIAHPYAPGNTLCCPVRLEAYIRPSARCRRWFSQELWDRYPGALTGWRQETDFHRRGDRNGQID